MAHVPLTLARKHLPPNTHTWESPCGVCPIGQLPAEAQAELLTLNESLVLLSGCLQMMTVTIEQRMAEMMSMKMAHNSTFVRAFFPSTVTMQKMMIRIAEDRERERERKRDASQLFLKFP